MAKNIKIDLTVQDKGSKEIKKFSTTTKASLSKLQSQIKKTSADFSTITKNLKKLTIAAAAVSAGIILLGKGAIKAASDFEEVSSKFKTVFKGVEEQAEAAAKTLVDSFGLSERAAKQYLSSMQDLLVPMGLNRKAAADLSSKIVQLAVDLGSFNNLKTEDVMRDIQSALVGNYETMKKYGVILNETVVKEEAYRSGLAKVGSTLSAQQKAQAAYSLIIKGSADAMGDWARTSGGFANQMKQLYSNMEDFKKLVGTELLPAITDIVKTFNEWFKANKEMLAQKVKEWFQGIKTEAKILWDYLVKVYNAYTKIAQAISDAIYKTPTPSENLKKQIEETKRSLLMGEASGKLFPEERTGGTSPYAGVSDYEKLSKHTTEEIQKQIDKLQVAKHWWESIYKVSPEQKQQMQQQVAQLKLLEYRLGLLQKVKSQQEENNKIRDAAKSIVSDIRGGDAVGGDKDTNNAVNQQKAINQVISETAKRWRELFDARREALAPGPEKEALEVQIRQQKRIFDIINKQKELPTNDELRKRKEAQYNAPTGTEKALAKAYMPSEKDIENYFKKISSAADEMAQRTKDALRQAGDSITSNITDNLAEAITTTGNFGEAFSKMAASIGADLTRIALKMMFLNSIQTMFGGTSFGGLFGFKDGGITPKIPGAAGGAVFNGPKSGYLANLHGNEAVIPLKNGKVPVEMAGSGGVSVGDININVNAQGSNMNEDQQMNMAKTVGRIVDTRIRTILKQENRIGGVNRQRRF